MALKELGRETEADGSATLVSWRPRRDLSLQEWAAQGRRMGLAGRHVGWWIGDWLRYGNAMYGERYSRASKVTGYDTQTLMNMVYVASQVDDARRRKALSWSHHAEVAALSDDDQQRWLSRAEAERLSVRDLREEIRRERRRRDSEVTGDDTGDIARACEDAHAVTCPGCGQVFTVSETV